MAKKALIIKAAAKPKFKVRGYTRCQQLRAAARGAAQVRPVPDLRARDGARRRAARRQQVAAGSTPIAAGPVHGNQAGKQ